MAKLARNTTGTSQTATGGAVKGTLSDLLAAAAKAAPAVAKTAKGPRATFTVTQMGEARMSSSGKTVLIAVTGETDSGARVGGTLWVKP